MSPIVTAFFNNKGKVGTTFLVYHLAWMFARLGVRVLVVDLDPQANLTAAFLDEDALEALWVEEDHARTLYSALQPVMERTGDVAMPHVEEIEDNLALLVGDLFLSRFEDLLAQEWPRAMAGNTGSLGIISAFKHMIRQTTPVWDADLVLLDLGPNVGAINRSALICADYIVVTVTPDLFALQGLRNLGPTLDLWRSQWQTCLSRASEGLDPFPPSRMKPVGYVVLRHSERFDGPVRQYGKWMHRIPEVYRSEVTGESWNSEMNLGNDPHCISILKHYRSLLSMGREARKPIFDLKPADGALGAHMSAAQDARRSFGNMAQEIAARLHLDNSVAGLTER